MGSAQTWIRSSKFKIYCNQALSSWGDRMWSFAVALYLANLSPNSLRLTAVYGFSVCVAIILFGPGIGLWVDRTPRLRAAQMALVLQNFFVVTCAAIVCTVMFLKADLSEILIELAEGCIILTAVLADLASLAGKLVIGKDWLVVIAKNSDELSHINASVRRIDLVCLICAPIVTGQLMTFWSMQASAIVIAGWNLFSVFLEYFLLSNIYHATPALSARREKRQPDAVTSEEGGTSSTYGTMGDDEKKHKRQTSFTCPSGSNKETVPVLIPTTEPSVWSRLCPCFTGSPCCIKIRVKFNNYTDGWKLYFKQDMLPAGLALAFLYMTVLGFDGITLGYANQQGVKQSILGGLSAIGAVVGILGTLAYPRLRAHLGIERTGLYGFFTEVMCLTMCVVSIWMPGSPFVPESIIYATDEHIAMHNRTDEAKHKREREGLPPDYTSIALLMTGIITARFGLWMADLTVNQLLQETVHECERGTVNGVQSALNMSMNMLKYILVIILPHPETFGYLIILSFAFICSGWVSYCVYSFRKRGHLLPMERWRHPSRYSPKPSPSSPRENQPDSNTSVHSVTVR